MNLDSDPRLAGVHKALDLVSDMSNPPIERKERILWILEGIDRTRKLVQEIETVIDAPGNEDILELMTMAWMRHVDSIAWAESELEHLRDEEHAN